MSNHYFLWILLLLQTVTAILAIRCWNKSKSIAWRIFILIWVISLLTTTAIEIIIRPLNNTRVYIWICNSFLVLFYPCVLIIYADVFKKTWLGRSALFVATGSAVWALSLALSNTKTFLGGYYIAIACSAIIFFALAYLVKLLLENDSTGSLKKDYYLWFSIGFIIYFSSEAVMSGMLYFNGAQPMQIRSFYMVIYFLTSYLLHIFLWIGFKSALKWIK